MKVTQKAQEALDGILSAFESGQVPEAIAHSVIPTFDVPCNKWSLNNRLLTFLSGTSDARGIDQWRQVGRWPKKGCHAVYILVPLIYTKRDDERGIDENELIGFRACPVFRYEDTDGKPLDVPQIDPPEPPPLLDIALSWGLNVKYMPFVGGYFGFYSAGRREIGLATHDEGTFFHELAHAAHDRINGGLSQVAKWKKEVVAELTAATLMHLFGKRPNDGGAYRYIAEYAQKAGKDAHRACLAVIARREQVPCADPERAADARYRDDSRRLSRQPEARTGNGARDGPTTTEIAAMAKAKRWTWAEATRECPMTISLLEVVTKRLMTAEEIRDALITIAGVMREARRAEKKAKRKKEARRWTRSTWTC